MNKLLLNICINYTCLHFCDRT